MSPDPSSSDPTKPSVARCYDYLLGGKDNYFVDRRAADMGKVVAPDAPLTARANRAFGKRAVRYLAEQGIRQFIDLGSGIPTTPPSVHETARAVQPSARVVYVDFDDVVVAHSAALRSAGSGVTTILADIREPDVILGHPELLRLINFDEPVAVLIFSVLDLFFDEDDPAGIVARFREKMAPGSYLAMSHFSNRCKAYVIGRSKVISRLTGFPQVVFRSDDEVRRLFHGFDLVEPGLVDITRWRPEQDMPSLRLKLVGAVGKKLPARGRGVGGT